MYADITFKPNVMTREVNKALLEDRKRDIVARHQMFNNEDENTRAEHRAELR